ncbi:MAG: cysteine desulfurase [Candidatus Nomurabacteria bacterium]|nr:cysteine desulfurase [Candidatus Nomurabacteria bacterium]
MSEVIYLDHAAATPISERVLAAMQPYFAGQFFNPSSPYLPAVRVRQAYEAAKDEIAAAIGAKGSDLVMTAGATESINLAFSLFQGDSLERGSGKKRALVSAIEHPAVLAAARAYANCETFAVSKYGLVDLGDLESKIAPDVMLVSVALVSGELGTIQPISDIARLVEAERLRRLQGGEKLPIYLHCDASQGFGLLDVNVARLGVDMLTLNAAKIYGPKQVGLLWVKPGVRLRPVVTGGGQEMGLRSGTENVAGAVGFTAAVSEAKRSMKSEVKRLGKLKKTLKDKLSAIDDIEFLGSDRKQLVSFLPVVIPGIDAERLIFMLEQDGVLLSTGAACAANKGEKSHVLAAIGLDDTEAQGSLRISLGKLNDTENVAQAAELIVAAVQKERARLNE